MRFDQSLMSYQLPEKVDTGIYIDHVDGVVPEYECREAAIFGHYNWMQWSRLRWRERASCVAHYKLHIAIEAHVNNAYEADAKMKQARDSAGRGGG